MEVASTHNLGVVLSFDDHSLEIEVRAVIRSIGRTEKSKQPEGAKSDDRLHAGKIPM